VAAVSPVISTIAIVDLLLLGFASTKRPLTELTRTAWTWVAIAVAAVSGALLFISRATEYTSKMLITGIAVLFVSLIGRRSGWHLPRRWSPTTPATYEPLETLGFPMRGAGLKALVVKRRRDGRWAFPGPAYPPLKPALKIGCFPGAGRPVFLGTRSHRHVDGGPVCGAGMPAGS